MVSGHRSNFLLAILENPVGETFVPTKRKMVALLDFTNPKCIGRRFL